MQTVKYFCQELILKKKCGMIMLYKKINESEEKYMAKKQRDIGRIATKVMAAILAILMIVGFAGTLIYYLVAA